ncbi:hypothetical protein [Facilibium subflavum]|uniref:hypothetical protein n=1 Tax=Facilibium subflavum TaxID=2219058 RepID=UPI000E65DDF0|nr:hypothetical protein [Facilibium subflavum]
MPIQLPNGSTYLEIKKALLERIMPKAATDNKIESLSDEQKASLDYLLSLELKEQQRDAISYNNLSPVNTNIISIQGENGLYFDTDSRRYLAEKSTSPLTKKTLTSEMIKSGLDERTKNAIIERVLSQFNINNAIKADTIEKCLVLRAYDALDQKSFENALSKLEPVSFNEAIGLMVEYGYSVPIKDEKPDVNLLKQAIKALGKCDKPEQSVNKEVLKYLINTDPFILTSLAYEHPETLKTFLLKIKDEDILTKAMVIKDKLDYNVIDHMMPSKYDLDGEKRFTAFMEIFAQFSPQGRLEIMTTPGHDGDTMLHHLAMSDKASLVIEWITNQNLDQKLKLINQENKQHETVLHLLAEENPSVLLQILQSLPENECYQLVTEKACLEGNVLHILADKPLALRDCLTLLPIDQHLDALCKKPLSHGNHVSALNKIMAKELDFTKSLSDILPQKDQEKFHGLIEQYEKEIKQHEQLMDDFFSGLNNLEMPFEAKVNSLNNSLVSDHSADQ